MNIKKFIVTLAMVGAMVMPFSTVMACEEHSDNSCIEYCNTINQNVSSESEYLPVFIPNNMDDESVEFIYSHQQENFPNSKVVIIKVEPENELTDTEIDAIIKSIDEDSTYTNVNSMQPITLLNTEVVNEAISDVDQIQERQTFALCSHKWDETTIGSPYVYYTKDKDKHCYTLEQKYSRICRKCDKTEQDHRTVSTVQHNWQYNKYGNYYYKCTYCGMRKA